MSSECNGKITKYEYDAAGRLVKEGKRSYSYSWLDKVSSVKENGVEVASFTYHMDGQIATAKANGRQENFLWDNLALILRNETEYVNEPYVTGGNPILADGDVLFNDLLGTTIGIRSGKEYRETGMTAFGETDEKSAMFTGKTYIGELGYAFLFRNYRPDQGKWQTGDPLFGVHDCLWFVYEVLEAGRVDFDRLAQTPVGAFERNKKYTQGIE